MDPAELAQPRTIGPGVKRLARNARVVVIGTDPTTLTDVTEVTTQRALEGFGRSSPGAALRCDGQSRARQGEAHDGVWSAVEFLLSGRSAYVDGQVVRVAETTGTNGDSVKPLAEGSRSSRGPPEGIGAEIAKVLGRDSATVVAVDVPGGEALARVANEVKGTASSSISRRPTPARASSSMRGSAMAPSTSSSTMPGSRDKLFVNLDEDRWDSVIDVNLRSILRMNEAILGEGGLGQGGRIVCLSSIAGIAGNRGQTNYGASKAGVIGLVTALAAQVKDGASPSTRWHPASSRPR